MTQERFLRYLSNPDLLATISYEEMKTLALTYPYANNLRYLLALKAGQDKHPDFERNLATAAAYSLNRTRLFVLVAPKRLVPQMVEQEEVVLELKPIATVQRELESKQPLARSEENTERRAAAQVLDAPRTENTEAPYPTPRTTAAAPTAEQEPHPPAPVLTHEMPAEQPPVLEAVPAPSPGILPSFGAWISQFSPPALTTPQKEKAATPQARAPEAPEEDEEMAETGETTHLSDGITPQMLAERSVKESKTIVSETLAKLYARQGYRDKAIDMYERLCLAFPDKCAYFAAEIGKLKK